MPRQMVQPNVPGAASNVRFNQTARNVAQQPQRQVRAEPMQNIANLSESDRKQLLGEQIFRKVEKINAELAGKITGMLIGMDTSDLVRMIESDEVLREKVCAHIWFYFPKNGHDFVYHILLFAYCRSTKESLFSRSVVE